MSGPTPTLTETEDPLAQSLLSHDGVEDHLGGDHLEAEPVSDEEVDSSASTGGELAVGEGDPTDRPDRWGRAVTALGASRAFRQGGEERAQRRDGAQKNWQTVSNAVGSSGAFQEAGREHAGKRARQNWQTGAKKAAGVSGASGAFEEAGQERAGRRAQAQQNWQTLGGAVGASGAFQQAGEEHARKRSVKDRWNLALNHARDKTFNDKSTARQKNIDDKDAIAGSEFGSSELVELGSTTSNLAASTADYDDIHKVDYDTNYAGIHQARVGDDKVLVNDEQGKGGERGEYNNGMGTMNSHGVGDMIEGAGTMGVSGLTVAGLMAQNNALREALRARTAARRAVRTQLAELEQSLLDQQNDTSDTIGAGKRSVGKEYQASRLRKELVKLDTEIEELERELEQSRGSTMEAGLSGATGLAKAVKGGLLAGADQRSTAEQWDALKEAHGSSSAVDARSGYGTTDQGVDYVKKDEVGADIKYKDAGLGKASEVAGATADGLSAATGLVSMGLGVKNAVNILRDPAAMDAGKALEVGRQVGSSAKAGAGATANTAKVVSAAGEAGAQAVIAPAATVAAVIGIVVGTLEAAHGIYKIVDSAKKTSQAREKIQQLRQARARLKAQAPAVDMTKVVTFGNPEQKMALNAIPDEQLKARLVAREEAKVQHKLDELVEQVESTLDGLMMLSGMQGKKAEEGALGVASGLMAAGAGIAMLCPFGAPVAVGLAIASGLLKVGSLLLNRGRNKKAKTLFDFARTKMNADGGPIGSAAPPEKLSPVEASNRLEKAYYNNQREAIKAGANAGTKLGLPTSDAADHKHATDAVRWTVQGKWDALGKPKAKRDANGKPESGNNVENAASFPEKHAWVEVEGKQEWDLPAYRDWNVLNPRKGSLFVEAGRDEIAEKLNEVAYNNWASGAEPLYGSLKGIEAIDKAIHDDKVQKVGLDFTTLHPSSVDYTKDATEMLNQAGKGSGPTALLDIVGLKSSKYENYLDKQFRKQTKKIPKADGDQGKVVSQRRELFDIFMKGGITNMTRPLAKSYAKKA